MSNVQNELLGPPRSGASISDCGRFRYTLWRAWGEQMKNGVPMKYANFIMLNPSTADATTDDPTIRRCVGFAKRWKLDGVAVTNLYPLRATDPAVMRSTPDRHGEHLSKLPAFEGRLTNDNAVLAYATGAEIVVCAWGVHAEPGKAHQLLGMLGHYGIRTHCLGVTKDGHPRHPLYLPAHAEIKEYPPR